MGYVIVLIVLGILFGVHTFLGRFTDLPRKGRWIVVVLGLAEAVTITIIDTILFGYGPPWTWDRHPEIHDWGWGFLIAFGGPAFLILFATTITVFLFVNRKIQKKVK
jgi:hypothetical protein